ncbi:hypothetical protein E2C01_033670 [Portunus trituberculatus]|uniref:Uncharacterized protein n=1 Tax=Portunus trituberculatus TaxID=210409 RepID=A0A5B7F424_PORTR|nr:hypothetical protein [Portunus trituberculatus]
MVECASSDRLPLDVGVETENDQISHSVRGPASRLFLARVRPPVRVLAAPTSSLTHNLDNLDDIQVTTE